MRAAGKAVMDDDTDDAATAPLSGRDAQWQAGVRRQALPDARQHQFAASQAAAAKRSAEAMSKEERQAKRRKHAKEVRERQRAERDAAAAQPATAQPAAAQPAAAQSAEEEPAITTPPSLELFNQWLQLDGYEQTDRDEWQEFEDDGAFEDTVPEDLQPAALIELFVEWRDSDQQQAAQMDRRVSDFVVSGMNLARPSPPPTQPRTATQPKCVECRRTVCACAPGAPDDDDPYQNPGAWANDMVGPSGWEGSPCSPPHDTGDDDYWDNFIDREHDRASGWWLEERLNGGWGERRVQTQWERERQERVTRWARERAAGPPPRREEVRFGPRGDAAGDQLFREKRAEWYQKYTGRSIEGVSLRDQNEMCDKYARRFRDYSDGRDAASATQRQRTDPDLLSMPQLTNLCMSCSKVRQGEHGLSHVGSRQDGASCRIYDRDCHYCMTAGSD